MSQRAGTVNAVVPVLLFASGAAGLIYEIVWTRYLALFLGHTSYAVLVVLAAFMGGLAIGSYWLGGRADRTTRPLLFYGWLELGIAAYGILFPSYYSLCHRAFVELTRELQPGDGGRLALKLGASVVTILLPTVLMGGTFPVLVKFMTRSVAEIRREVASLYAINSAGAVTGCLLADFWLIPSSGLEATVRWAVGLNVVAGIGALLLGRRAASMAAERTADGSASPSVARGATDKASPPASLPATSGRSADKPVHSAPRTGAMERAAAVTPERFSAAELRLAMIGIGVSGFAAMLYEVAWTRLLALAMGSSTHAFSIMLATFIAGIAVGAWVIAGWKSPRWTLEAFAWSEVALAVTVLGSMFLYAHLPYGFARLANLLARREEAYPLYETVQAVTCFGVMFVPTVCLGMTLPLASRIATQGLSNAGGAVGRVYSVNTLGTILGAVVTGVWLMPGLGLARTLGLGVGANAAVGLALLGRRSRAPVALSVGLILVLMAVFAGAAGAWFGRWPQTLAQGLWRRENLPASWAEFSRWVADFQLKYYRDGAGSTVSVNTFTDGAGNQALSLRVNGKPDAGTAVDMPTQLLLGHVPMLLRPQSGQALVVGLGSGVTCGAIATHPSVRRLDVVEISPEVVSAARVFASANGNVLDDPRLHLAVEDAKLFMQITPRTYDIIVSEPSNPWVAGVAGVFSREFFRSCRDRLRRDGLMAQWVQLYETSDEALDIVLRTFTEIFPHTSVWRLRDDLILVGAAQPTPVSLDALEQRFNVPAVRADFARVALASVPLLLASEIVGPENGLYAVPPHGPRHSDHSPVLEFVAQRAFFARGKPARWDRLDETESPRPGTLLGQYLGRRDVTADDVRTFVAASSTYGFPSARVVRSLLRRWQQAHPADSEPMELAARLPGPEAAAGDAVLPGDVVRDKILADAAADPKPLMSYRSVLWQTYKNQCSAFYVPPSAELQAVLSRLIEVDPANQRTYKFELARLAWDMGRDQPFVRLALSALDLSAPGSHGFDLDPDLVPEVISRLAELAWRDGQEKKALELCKLAVDGNYSDPRLEMVQRKLQARAAGRSAAR